MLTTRTGCSSTETVTPAFEKVSCGSEMANQKWSIPIQNMHMVAKEKKKAGNNQEFLNVKEKKIYLI